MVAVNVRDDGESWAARVERLLSDEFMAFLALLTILITVAPYAFELSDFWSRLMVAAELLVVVFFVVEYAAGLAAANNKKQFYSNPWRILDAIIIVVVLISLLPLPTDLLSLAPAFRLARLARVAVLGTRSSVRLTLQAEDSSGASGQSDAVAEALTFDTGHAEIRLLSLPWRDAVKQIETERDNWIYLSNFDKDNVSEVADRLNVPERLLSNRLFESAFPRLDALGQVSTVFVWYPGLKKTNAGVRVERTALLLVVSPHNVTVLTRGETDLPTQLTRQLSISGKQLQSQAILPQSILELLRIVVQAYQRVVDHLETTLAGLEAAEMSLRDREFLSRTFLLRSEVTRVRSTLRHLSALTRSLSPARVSLEGFEGVMPQLKIIAGEAADLYERADDVNLNLTMLVDMRLNISSFQMNKVMRILAILTTLAIIPAVVGGLLGMNVIGNPWPISMSAVVFWIGGGMLLCLYFFAIKGWFK